MEKIEGKAETKCFRFYYLGYKANSRFFSMDLSASEDALISSQRAPKKDALPHEICGWEG